MELPAGGVFMGDLGCNRAFTAMRGERLEKGLGKLPRFACDVSCHLFSWWWEVTDDGVSGVEKLRSGNGSG